MSENAVGAEIAFDALDRYVVKLMAASGLKGQDELKKVRKELQDLKHAASKDRMNEIVSAHR